ncbi:MAG: response regulator transcription factor [Cyclobacteriaceae bacterium]
MSAFNILVVEDELIIAEMIKEMLVELGYKVNGIAKNYAEAMAFLEQSDAIHLSILDINLEDDRSGIDIGNHISQHYPNLPFIYLTSYTDKKTVQKAASSSPEAYLSKPFTSVDLYTTIEIIRARIKTSKQVIIQDGRNHVRIETKDIRYIKSDNNYLEAFTSEKTYLIRNSLNAFMEEIDDPNFIRVHRSYVVNMLHVKSINGQYVYVGEDRCPISRNYKQEVVQSFQS